MKEFNMPRLGGRGGGGLGRVKSERFVLVALLLVLVEAKALRSDDGDENGDNIC